MNIIVCIKQVPSSETKPKIARDGMALDPSDISYAVNPYDEFGVEEALRIKERLGKGDITVISAGTSKAAEALRTSLAMGADRAILINDPVFAGSDSLGIAAILAAAIKTIPHDLIFFGKQAIDDDMGSVGIMVAELLRLPHVAVVNKLDISSDQKTAVVQRQIEGAHEIFETPLPAVLTCQKGLNEPRYPSLPGIMKAKSKPLAEMTNDTLKLDPKTVGWAGKKVRLIKLALPSQKRRGQVMEGTLPEAVKKLVQLLKEEAKAL